MEAREWAKLILEADTLEQKLLNPGKLTDNEPGLPVFYKEPVRPPGMGFNKRSKKEKLPERRAPFSPSYINRLPLPSI